MENLKGGRMEAQDFYEKRVKENPEIDTPQLMEEYAKHIIEINFFDGSPIEFDEMSTEQLKNAQRAINRCVEWVNSETTK